MRAKQRDRERERLILSREGRRREARARSSNVSRPATVANQKLLHPQSSLYLCLRSLRPKRRPTPNMKASERQ